MVHLTIWGLICYKNKLKDFFLDFSRIFFCDIYQLNSHYINFFFFFFIQDRLLLKPNLSVYIGVFIKPHKSQKLH